MGIFTEIFLIAFIFGFGFELGTGAYKLLENKIKYLLK